MKRLALAALAMLAVIPYAGAIHAPLLYDDRTMLDNRWLLHDAGPVSVFGKDYWYGTNHERSDLYRPLTVLSLAWNMQAAPSREGVRIVNIAAHAAAVLAAYWMLSLLLAGEAAWIGAALFAVHPLASEAVLNAVGRAEIFAALLGLSALALFAGLGDRKDLGGVRLALSAGAFFGALCFKESAAAWLVIGAAFVALRRPPAWPRRIALARGAIFLAMFAAYLALRISVVGWAQQPRPFVDNPLAEVDAMTRATNAAVLFARYAFKMIWPATLSVDYGFDQIAVIPLFPWGAIAATTIAVTLAAVVVALHRKGRFDAAFLTALVPASFAVTANLLLPIGTVFAERLAYTALVGVCGLAGIALASIPKRAARWTAVAALLLVCAGRTIVRGSDYRDLAAFNEATAAASPRAVKALVNAGRTRLRAGDAAGARPLFTRAAGIWPDYARAWRLLAEACTALGDTPCAEEAGRREKTASSRAAPGSDPL